MVLIRGFLVAVAWRKRHPFDPKIHHFVEEGYHADRICIVVQGRVGGYPEATPERLPDSFNSFVVRAFPAHGTIMGLPLPVQVDIDCKIFIGAEEVQFLLKHQRICTQIHEFFKVDQTLYNIRNLRVQ